MVRIASHAFRQIARTALVGGVLRCKRGRKSGSDEDRRSMNGSPHRFSPVVLDQSGFFATPTMAGRSRRSLIMYPACISCTMVPGSASSVGISIIA